MIKKMARKQMLYLMLVALMAFNILAIHHHHHDAAVPIVVELFGSADEDAADNHCCPHPDANKCGFHQTALYKVPGWNSHHTTAVLSALLTDGWKPAVMQPVSILLCAGALPELLERWASAVGLRAPPIYSFFTTNLLSTVKQFVKNEYISNIAQRVVGARCSHGSRLL